MSLFNTVFLPATLPSWFVKNCWIVHANRFRSQASFTDIGLPGNCRKKHVHSQKITTLTHQKSEIAASTCTSLPCSPPFSPPTCRGFWISAAHKMKPLSMKNHGTQVYPHEHKYLRVTWWLGNLVTWLQLWNNHQTLDPKVGLIFFSVYSWKTDNNLGTKKKKTSSN